MGLTSAFSENDIRPQELMRKKREYLKADVRFLSERAGAFVRVDCPACDGQGQEKFRKTCHTYEECASCGTIFVNPRPNEKTLAEFYGSSQNYWFWNQYIFPASEEIRRVKIFRPRVDRVISLCAEHGVGRRQILEVGAGFGIFCEEMQKTSAFKEVIALEPEPNLAASCRKRGLKAISKRIEELSPADASPDVIVSFEVIEHLFSPAKFIRSASAMLAESGLLILTCPNVRGFDMRILGMHAPTFDHEHLNYFHPASLELLLGRFGFEKIDHSTPGLLDVGIVRRVATELEGVLDHDPFIRDVVLSGTDSQRTALQCFLRDAHLSSHMWMVARKK